MKKLVLAGVTILVIFALIVGGNNWSEMSEKEITKVLQQEKQVLSGSVYQQDDMIIAAIVLSPEASNEYGIELAQEYANKLAKRNPDLKVNVQAVRNGENVAYKLLEPKK